MDNVAFCFHFVRTIWFFTIGFNVNFNFLYTWPSFVYVGQCSVYCSPFQWWVAGGSPVASRLNKGFILHKPRPIQLRPGNRVTVSWYPYFRIWCDIYWTRCHVHACKDIQVRNTKRVVYTNSFFIKSAKIIIEMIKNNKFLSPK